MRMKPSSPGRKPVSRAKAKNAALLNLLATPGLGSLLCGRWIAGAGQLVLCVAGFAVFIVWFVKEMIRILPWASASWMRFALMATILALV